MTSSPRPVQKGDHIFLVDGSNFIFRAYFQSMNQDQKYNYRADRLPTGALRLFCAKLFQFIEQGAAGLKPTHLAIIFDKSENSFRKEIFPAYKGTRSDPPDDLVPQFPLMRDAVRAFGLKPIEQDVYEADDLIATYARQARERGADVLIVSADKDLMQLVGPGVSMFDPASGDARKGSAREERRIGVQEVIDYFGVPPERVVDVQSLAGDSTDNVPGAPGIGVKTAALLINEYGDLDTLLARAGEIKQPKRRETLTNPQIVENVRLSRRLVSLIDDVAVETPLEDLSLVAPDGKQLVAFLKAMEFSTITRRAAEVFGVEAGEIEPDPAFVGKAGWRGRDGAAIEPPPQPSAATRGQSEAQRKTRGDTLTPAGLVEARLAEARATPFDRASYKTIASQDDLDLWIGAARQAGLVALAPQASGVDPMTADLVGMGIAVAPGLAAYLPLAHRKPGETDLFGGDRADGQMDDRQALTALAPLLSDAGVIKIVHDAKFATHLLAACGVTLAPCDDPQLLSYTLDAGVAGHDLDTLTRAATGHAPLQWRDLVGSGKNFVGFARASIDKATEFAGEAADATLRVWRALKPRLVNERMTSVYETLERPMIATLARMERRGVTIDRQILSRLSGDFAQSMARLEADIHTLAGEPFNLGSPKQLGDILFGKMGLAGGKKTATGAWSTAANVLEELAAEGHALPSRIMEWRALSKLKSNYTDALPGYVNAASQRVHTSYALAATTTGRLSSNEPNLQNIPIRTEDGRKIRTAFVAPAGHKLISADYSQIELRILAHMADIPQLKRAFADGLDIHALTASEMFNTPVQGMPADVRRRAKAINFGIIYGISAFGLANQLSIPREEAGAYIRRYFERFPGIRDYMEAMKKACREQGFVTTLFGRKCHYPRISSSNPSERANMERAAINAPIQGTAADIIRRAMARMDEALRAEGLDAQMLLQVHDELVFEAPDAQVDATIAVVRRVMAEAPLPAVALSVPLQVDAKAAQNWDEAH